MKKLTEKEFQERLASLTDEKLNRFTRAYDVEITTVQSLNQPVEAIKIMGLESDVGYMVDLQSGYSYYLDGHEVEEMADQLVSKVQSSSLQNCKEVISSYELARKNLFVRVSGKSMTEQILDNVPYRRFEDLVLTCHIQVAVEDSSFSSVLVTDALLNYYDVTEEQLFEDAIESAQELFPAKIQTLGEVLGREKEESEIDICKVLVVTNDHRINGASALFYPGIMEKIAGMCGGSYYAVPSSIHEMLIFYDCKEDYHWIVRMVSHMNTVIREKDVLSDQVYFYDSVTGTFRVCGDLIA